MKKKYLLYAILPVVTAISLIGAACAAANVSKTDNPISGLVTAIAEKFNLNANDVQQVFDEEKSKMDAQREEQMATMETQRQQELEKRIAQAVTDGKLTQEQADKILAKKTELEAQKTSPEGKTEESRTKMKDQMDSLKQWAMDNNIPEEYLMFAGFGMGEGHRGSGGPGFNRPALDKSSNQTADSSSQ